MPTPAPDFDLPLPSFFNGQPQPEGFIMSYLTINPATEQVLARFPEHTDDQIEKILVRADHVYKTGWGTTPLAERCAVIAKAASILREQREHFAQLVTLEMGKLLREAGEEVDLAADILQYYADNGPDFLAPKTLEVTEGSAWIESAPLGVLFCIEPWNFPYYQLVRVTGPNLVLGNTLIVKHAPSVPQCALAFERLLLDAGAPLGAYANVFASNDQSAKIIADPRIKGVALTGSNRAGAAVAAEAGAALKKSTMELGGSDAFIVLDDADMDVAIEWGMWGKMNNTGECCIAAKRYILDEKIADAFIERFKQAMENLIPGDPMEPSTTLGPLSSENALTIVQEQIDTAIRNGAKVLLGGKRIQRPGYYLEATILTDIGAENPAYYEEFFAPVALIFRVKDESEAICLANDSLFGLGGSVITKDVERGRRVARQIETGMVFINKATWTAPELPFGGVKNSGYGRELSELGIGEFVNKKLIRVA
jgi:succinate-semialdehyde dehydrogenase/glutarate-semialdehyde dehydrogenase